MPLIFLSLFLATFNTSLATTLSHSTTTVDLTSLNFYTTGTLEISLRGTSISGRTDNSSSSFWKTENELGVRSVLNSNDLFPYGGGYTNSETYKWLGHTESNLHYSQRFTTHGSGYLKATIEGSWQYHTERWAAPDNGPGGPDTHITFFDIHNSVTTEWLPGGIQSEERFIPHNRNMTFHDWEYVLLPDGDGWDSPGGLYFTDEQTGFLHIWLVAAAGGRYIDLPVQPVPEPSTVMPLGLGILGLIGFGTRKSK